MCYERLFGRYIRLLDFGIGSVVLWSHQAAFGGGDTAGHKGGVIGLWVEVLLLDYLFDSVFAVVGVVDGEIVNISEFVGLDTQDFGKHRVESAHPDVLGFGADKRLDTVFHLLGRLVGKCKCQNIKGIHPLVDQVGDAVGQSAGLARACAGNNHHRSVDNFGSTALFVVQFV